MAERQSAPSGGPRRPALRGGAQQQAAIQQLAAGSMGAFQPITSHLTRQLLELQ